MSYNPDVDIIKKFKRLMNYKDVELYEEIVEDMNSNRFTMNWWLFTSKDLIKFKTLKEARDVFWMITHEINHSANKE